MKKAILFTFFIGLIMNISAISQTPKNDQIFKMDNSVISCIIDEISETEIFYKLPNNLNGGILKVAKSSVLKITYSNGTTDIINKAKEKTEKIIKKDGSTIEGKIINVTKDKIEYTNPYSYDGAVYVVSGIEVSKVVYPDGSTKSMASLSKAFKEKKDKPKVEKKDKIKIQTFEKQYVQQNQTSKPKQVSDLPHFVITAGVDGNYVLEPLSKRWVATDDSAAIQQGIGASLRADLHLTKGIALSATIGFNQWQVQRNYISTDPVSKSKIIQYSSSDKFQTIPIQLGFKLYIANGFYLQPQGTFNLISSTLANKDENILNPNGNGTTKTSLSKIGYGGSIGCEIYKLPFVVDMSVFVQSINANGYKGIDEPLYYTGLRLGVGFGK